jgi:hypothetical protein
MLHTPTTNSDSSSPRQAWPQTNSRSLQESTKELSHRRDTLSSRGKHFSRSPQQISRSYSPDDLTPPIEIPKIRELADTWVTRNTDIIGIGTVTNNGNSSPQNPRTWEIPSKLPQKPRPGDISYSTTQRLTKCPPTWGPPRDTRFNTSFKSIHPFDNENDITDQHLKEPAINKREKHFIPIPIK